MDKKQAVSIVKKTLESSFDKTSFFNFISNLLNQIEEASFTYRGNYIPDAFEEYISSLERVGKYSDGEHSIDILIVHLKKETSIERARTMQRNFIAWYLNGSRGGQMKDAALAAFVSPNTCDWRFSLVKMDYRFEQTKSGKIKIKEAFTPARRWSFLVGTNENSRTAQSRLVPVMADDKHNPTLAELEDAFNIEKVTKEFFEKYRELFLRTKEELDKTVSTSAIIKNEFERKGVNTVDFAKKLLGQIVFLYFLQKKGWFGIQKDAEWGTGSKHFLRELFDQKHGQFNNFFNDILEPLFYEALRIDHSHDDHYYSKFNCKIPFLNGGLFDPMNNYDRVRTDILIPDELFSNTCKTKEGDTGDGILDVFDRYNFTVKEDEPLEKEVAIDPELLGKTYEKFNAIRPDNYHQFLQALKSGKKGEESKFNKQYGVYYTPREIVHYMCQQSLIHYLAAELEGKATKEEIEILIHYGENLSENEAEVEKSGKETGTYKHNLPESIRNNADQTDSKLAEIKVCDPAIGSGAFPVGMMSEITKARSTLSTYIKNQNRTIYNFKRDCIENSLYGVDIDSGAVEIAKLRLWLSLVVDEDDIKQIKPLPNLDYKIVCGNSLLGVKKDLFNNELFEQLEKIKPLYFNETNPTKKQEYKKQIDGLISSITNGHMEFDFEVYFSEVFHEKGGFDVVIGNPPYVRVDEISIAIKRQFKINFTSSVGKYDLYYLFIEKGINLLKDNGNLVFITPNRFCASSSGKLLRELVLSKMGCCEIVSTSKLRVFEEASNYPVISIFQKSQNASIFTVREALDIEKLQDSTSSVYHLTHSSFDNLPDKIIPINISQHKVNFVIRLLNRCSRLGNYLIISEGLRIPAKYEQESEYDFRIVKQYQFERWSSIKQGAYITRSNLLKVITDKSSRFKKIDENKILIAEDALQITATLDEYRHIPQGGVYFGTVTNTKIDLKVILSVLNSKLLSAIYEFLFSGMHMGGGYLRYRTNFLEVLPIKEVSKSYSNMLNSIVTNILTITQFTDYHQDQIKQAQVREYERQIDQLVYELYELTEEEIRIVEGDLR